MSDPSVLLEVRGPLATITMNRPDRNNGITLEMAEALRDAAHAVGHRKDVHVVLLRGAGKRFCVGVDLAWLRPEEPGCVERMAGSIAALNAFVLALRTLPGVVVAAVQGAAAGGGFSLMCAADLVVAQEGLTLTTAYTRIGGTPDCGLSWVLPRLVGERKALELMLLSHPLDAAEARRLGLLQMLVPEAEFPAAVERLVAELVAGPPGAYATTKRLVTGALDAAFPTHLEAELAGMLAAHAGGEMPEGIRAFMQKRPADYSQGRPAP